MRMPEFPMADKKRYFQPEIEIVTMAPLAALCESGDKTNLGGEGNGENPWDYGRVPQRPGLPPF